MAVRTYPHGVPCWVDTEQPDVDAAARFYGRVFGWSFEDAMPPGEGRRYVIATLHGEDVCGIAGPGGGTPHWNTYVSVDDADAASARLASLGARIRSEPADAGAAGRGAALEDPEGAEIRLWQAGRRPGAQAVNLPGGGNFSDLHTAAAPAAREFYAAGFGWLFVDLGFGTMIARPGYGDHLEATTDPDIRSRQSDVHTPVGFEDAIRWLAPAAPDEAPHWHVTFSVADRDAFVEDAVRLGARVLAVDESEWTRSALVRDPQGAEFTASQFTPPSG